ncbi:dihydrolipoyl dehydrogenase [Ignavigranum ruoffiae]|uniref:dihydrolipoyl dehydrogenase n=1 Tax=Ignavigranum ruoffiae TaxID=89093 RepID=UPI00204D8115|nr:dihydrolipoyl dehydrogenase [Ignavigranum ruoffiae]UPQ86046.1 dihydrolipoyl dehydrogenase [Ignavigranum ruoffiae]
MAQYDVVIVGAGPGGYVAAEEAARLGKKVAVVERNKIGGTCLNVGCIPSKAYLEHAHWLHTINKSQKYGIDVEVKSIDFKALRERKNQVVSTLKNGIHSTFKSLKIDYIEGEASFKEDGVLYVDGNKMNYQDLILATGGRPFIPPIPGLDQVDYLTTDSFFDLDSLPDKMVIIGGGVIAIELAYALQAFGVKVTVLEVAKDILLTEDPDARKIVKQAISSLIDIHIQVKIKEVGPREVILEDGSTYPFDQLLVATGRLPNTELAQSIGLEFDDKGRFLKVDAYYQTSKPHIYAIGDLIGGYTLAHAASAEGIKAVRAIAGQKERPVQMKSVPRSLFVSPEVASFGITVEEAQDKGYEVLVKQMPFGFNGRAIAQDTTDGFVKLIVERKYGEILGCVVCGPNASEILHQVLTLVESEGTVTELLSTIFSHPTVSELVQETARLVVSEL